MGLAMVATVKKWQLSMKQPAFVVPAVFLVLFFILLPYLHGMSQTHPNEAWPVMLVVSRRPQHLMMMTSNEGVWPSAFPGRSGRNKCW